MQRPPTLPCIFLAALAQTAAARPIQATFVPPDDSGFVYSGYVNANIDSVRASFDRLPITAVGALHSPGVRIDFVSDAVAIHLRVDYASTLSPAGAGKFRLEVDGVLTASEIGSSADLGPNSYLAFQQPTAMPHSFSLIYPYASDVDFLGLELIGGSANLLAPPPSPPSFAYVAHGDSITHGFVASSVTKTYPYQVGATEGWETINLGFFGRKVVPSDGTVVGGLGADWVTLAIGTNDWEFQTSAQVFTAGYEALLDNLRAIQPDVPVFALTPTWTDHDSQPNTIGLTVDDYRAIIRSTVLARTAFDPQLHLIEGHVLVPPGPLFFDDGIHPNDAGFAFYALGLAGANLVADPSFEFGGFAWTDLGSSTIDTTNPAVGSSALVVGPGPGGSEQPVGRVRRGLTYMLRAWSALGSPGDQGSFGISFYDHLGTETQRDEISIGWTSFQQRSVPVLAPSRFAQAKVWCSAGRGSVIFVDGFELTEATDLPDPKVYCTAKTNSLGCLPQIGFSGTPSAQAPIPFDVNAFNVLNGRNGLLFYGYAAAAIAPFNSGVLCAQPPLRRLAIQNSGGTPPPVKDCSGSYAFDFNAHVQSGSDPFLVPGRQVNGQWWARDPMHPDGTGTGLSNAVEFFVGP